MGLFVNTNSAALNAQRQLNSTSSALGRSFERLCEALSFYNYVKRKGGRPPFFHCQHFEMKTPRIFHILFKYGMVHPPIFTNKIH